MTYLSSITAVAPVTVCPAITCDAAVPVPGADGVATTMLAVIVNYRTADLVVACLRSLRGEVAAVPGFRVTVVDNASGDGSGDVIAAAIATGGWSGWASLLRSPANGGFASGNNLAIGPAIAPASLGRGAPDLVWLVNPDTTVRAGAASALVRFMDRTPRAGIVGTALELGDGTPWPFAGRFPSILSELEGAARLGILSRLLERHRIWRRMGATPRRVDWVPGASMAVRRRVFEEVGLMDEGYFLNYEETDFCLQAARAGWECWYLPDAVVRHVGGASTGINGMDAAPARMPRYLLESRRRYFVKNHGVAYAAVADAAWIAMHALWRIRRRVAGRPDPDPPFLLRDFCSFVFGRPKAT